MLTSILSFFATVNIGQAMLVLGTIGAFYRPVKAQINNLLAWIKRQFVYTLVFHNESNGYYVFDRFLQTTKYYKRLGKSIGRV